MQSKLSSCPYLISSYVCYDHISPTYKASLAAYSAVFEPSSYAKACKDPLWVKYKSNGEVERYKVRFVAKGYSQEEGLDYKETFSPVAKMVTVRWLFKPGGVSEGSNLVVILVYVDDLLVTGTNLKLIEQVGKDLQFGEALISWKSKNQGTVSGSLVGAEFRSMATTVAEATWLTGLFRELNIEVEVLIHLFYDSRVAIQIAAHPIFHERIKHIDIGCHFVRGKI
ncbi:uncharacterized protein LOC142162430 [Nicotiana tabacum]|uniref:Uncharacterized protein LOC142162430 n=1 Tax=Nicotiana tabacum TaxID=4097 RepID=A0AC58RQ85_TOBAC